MWNSIGEIVLDTLFKLILILLIPFFVVYAIIAGFIELCIVFFDAMTEYFKWIKEGI